MRTSTSSFHENTTSSLTAPLLHGDDSERNEPFLAASFELQAVAHPSRDEAEISIDRFPMNEKVQDFLTTLGISLEDNLLAEEVLEELLKVELNSYRSTLRWANFDSALERLLQVPMIGRAALRSSDEVKEGDNSRIWLHGRSLPLHHKLNLKSALLARNFLRGIELTTFKGIHYFFYGLLGYHLYQLITTGRDDFSDVWNALTNIKDNGLVNLVQALARLPTSQLKILLSLLPLPTMMLMVNGLARSTLWNEAKLNEALLSAQPYQTANFMYTELWQWLPILPVSSRIQSLEWALRWQAPLNHEDKWRIVRHLQDLALHGQKYIQRSAMQSLAKLLHSFHAKDLMILANAGCPSEVLHDYLAIKQASLQTLQQLAEFSVEGEGLRQIQHYMNQTIRVIYANYLLWWVGYSPNKKASVLFPTLKAIKLALEMTLLINLIKVIQDALDCPKQPDFVFGEGFVQDWAGDFTPECFTARLRLFRTLDIRESVDQLIVELQNYHLIGLTLLEFSGKGLTAEEVVKLVNAVIQRGAQITVLNLRSNALDSLPQKLFIYISQLQTLDLSYNQLMTLPSNALAPLTQLQALNLGWNRLTILPSDVFTRLSQLQTLDLSGNQINTLASYTFENLSQLKTLNLNHNQFTTLTSDVFVPLVQLQTLDLSRNNQLKTLAPDTFAPLVQLKTLDLGDTLLTTIPIDALIHLSQLQTLGLNNNQLTTIPPDAFASLIQLQTLDLRFNQLTTILTNAFAHLSQLQTLGLSGNRLTTISSDAFAPLVQLKTLDLSGNQLTTILTNPFAHLSQLQTLGLSSNRLTTLSFDALTPLIQLQTLALNGNLLTTIASDAFTHLPQLQTLGLNGNQLTALPSEALASLAQLQTLDLSHNQFTSIPSNALAHLSQLQALDLSFNRLVSLPTDALMSLSQLQWLDLSYNQLTTFPSDALAQSIQLQVLYLNNNQLANISIGDFTQLSQLQTLDLSKNQIKMLASYTFANLPQLQVLFISGNQLSVIPSRAFMNLPQLNRLNLNNNNISHIDEAAFFQVNFLQGILRLNGQHLNDEAIYNLSLCLPSGITELDLQYNNIGQNGFKALASILPCTNITKIQLSNNPVNTSMLNLQAQANALRDLCEAQRCQDVWPTHSCEVEKPEGLSTSAAFIELGQNDLSEIKKTSTSLLKRPWTWFKGLMNKALESACHALGSYAQEVVSSCPAYFDQQAADKMAIQQPLQLLWSDSPHTLFPPQKINQSSRDHLPLSNTTRINFSRP